MSAATHRRIPKRSIIGSCVCVQTIDSIWRQGTITAVRCDEDRLVPLERKYQVEICTPGESITTERCYSEDEIVGPGFLSILPNHTKLHKGQSIYVTNSGREVKGVVLSHNTDEDCVELQVDGVGTIFKPLEDIRLTESRKSARLINTDTDFSRMADLNIAQQRKQIKDGLTRRRLHSMSSFPDKRLETQRRMRQSSDISGSNSSACIDVPLSRKRRTSESRLELESGYSSGSSGYSSSLSSSILKSRDDLLSSSFLRSGEDIRDCTAAMVLMNLSASPTERWKGLSSSFNSSCLIFPSSPETQQPETYNLLLEEDEEPSRKQHRSSSVMFQCTWRGCSHLSRSQETMETHVRVHLGRPEPSPEEERDYEEEFYYTELEPEQQLVNESIIDILEADIIIEKEFVPSPPSPSPPCPSPPSGPESPNYLATSAPSSLSLLQYGVNRSISEHLDMAKPPTLYLFPGNQNKLEPDPAAGPNQFRKLVSIIPRPEEGARAQPFVFPPPRTLKSDRKCRKIYGLEQKDQWCTQCKWKKACARFS